MTEDFVFNDGKIHVISQDGPSDLLVLMIPGMFGIAEHCLEEFKILRQFSVMAVSLRGRGKSDRDQQSFSFASHVSDILAVIDSRKEDKIVLFAHSFGCLLAVAAAAKIRKRIVGLILVDKGLKLEGISEKWLQRVTENPPPTSSLEIAKKIYDEFVCVDLTDDFRRMHIPTLVFKGEAPGHVLTENEAQEIASFENTTMVRLKNSGHWPNGEDYGVFSAKINEFLESL